MRSMQGEPQPIACSPRMLPNIKASIVLPPAPNSLASTLQQGAALGRAQGSSLWGPHRISPLGSIELPSLGRVYPQHQLSKSRKLSTCASQDCAVLRTSPGEAPHISCGSSPPLLEQSIITRALEMSQWGRGSGLPACARARLAAGSNSAPWRSPSRHVRRRSCCPAAAPPTAALSAAPGTCRAHRTHLSTPFFTCHAGNIIILSGLLPYAMQMLRCTVTTEFPEG